MSLYDGQADTVSHATITVKSNLSAHLKQLIS